jgi:hypothetical protein
MMSKQYVRPWRVHHPGGSGHMADRQRPLKTVRMIFDKFDKPIHHWPFVLKQAPVIPKLPEN